ncbi:exosortase A system-associated hydrolase 1 [Variovorax sp. SRS16]|uniref:alpha/beta hydrolase family protein n=1 Tax=Variovorax sp. SRS16 TaxID=282217 RepID=UPI0013161453|nr:alpha/beta hydrolase family protein [Variovorax sp. SRS16]VTU14161.1 exosortase A system-associated hydrolase 1 [Variovorax sp. SRS16]
MNPPKEEPVLFGPASALFGVLTRPASGASAPVACLMSNFGVTHHIGPHRIQVKLARQLAAQGIATLRFDLTGIGDSPASGTAKNFESQAQDDLRAAIDYLESKLGVKKVVIFGLCSGVAHGLRIAVADTRVTGLLAFDGYRFPGRRAELLRLWRRFLKYPVAQSVHWAKRLAGASRQKDNLLESREPESTVTAADFARSMETLVAREVSVYLVYSASHQPQDRNKDQMLELRGAPFLEKVRYEFMPAVDHSFTLLSSQRFFSDAACSWVEEITQRVSRGAAALPPAAADARRGTQSPGAGAGLVHSLAA